MLKLLVIALFLAACGAEAPAPSPTADAGPDGARCLMGQVWLGDRCASRTDTNCDGRTCPVGQFCFLVDGVGGNNALRCMAE